MQHVRIMKVKRGLYCLIFGKTKWAENGKLLCSILLNAQIECFFAVQKNFFQDYAPYEGATRSPMQAFILRLE